MSFLSMAHMYQVVRDMYPSRKWRERVLNMTDNQIMAIYFDHEEREAARKAKTGRGLKHTLQEKVAAIRAKNADEAIELGKVKEILTGFDGSTDDYIPEQLSFFD